MPPPAEPRSGFPELAPARVPAPGPALGPAPADASAGPGAPAFVLVLVLACAISAPCARALAADSLSVRVEVGTATAVSNEQFYESAIDDTTFLGRRLHDAPEARVAAVLLADLFRSFGEGRWQVRFSPDVSIGDEAVRAAASASLRGRPSERVLVTLEPRAEYRRDEGFGMLRRDWRASVLGRVRRLLEDEFGALRFSAGTELVRALEGSNAFVLSGTSARAAVGYSRAPLFGPEWDVEYGAIARVFRDSTERDHVEHRLAASVRGYVWGIHELSLSAGADRRVATRQVTGSRDRFAQFNAEAVAVLQLADDWSLRPELRGEYVRYDEPDSVVEFDYRLARAQLLLRRGIGTAWRAGAGPRGEWLVAPWCPAEEYREFACVLELERITGGSLWNLAPVVGRRTYERSATAAAARDLLAPVLHSSFDFVELTGFLDQPLPAALRLRAFGAVRAERHTNPDHDARSLYFSVDVRRLF